MKKYSIVIKESLEKTIVIDAKDCQEAISKVKHLHSIGEIVLYPEECDIMVEFDIIKEKVSSSN